MDTDTPPPEDTSTAPIPVTPDQAQPQGLTFDAEQVKFLLKEFANLGQTGAFQAAQQGDPSTQPLKAKGQYNEKFGWMHIIDREYGVKWLFAGLFVALAVSYLLPRMRSDFDESTISAPLMLLQPYLLLGAGGVVITHIIVRWRRSRLYTTDKAVIFSIAPFWPLLVLKKEQRANLQKIDASVYSQNIIEQALNMNSGTLTIDTAAQNDTELHELKGVRNVQQLRQDIG